MIKISKHGPFQVVLQDRNKQGSPAGMRTGWAEYQVREGKRVISRHERLKDAQQVAHEASCNRFWYGA